MHISTTSFDLVSFLSFCIALAILFGFFHPPQEGVSAIALLAYGKAWWLQARVKELTNE